MTDMMRDMIAQLMGSKREAEEGRTIVPYNHHSVCRGYLLHSCPAEILADSRLESLVTCRKLHEPAHRADFETEQAKQDHFYDIEAYDMLCQAVRTVDNEIAKIRDKIRKDSEDQEDSAEYVKTQKIFEVNEKIGKALARMEELGNEGKVEESMQLATQLEEMKKKKRELEADLRGGGNGSTQRLRVCEECGAQLNILDHESRLADHFGGKMHLGMVDIRERLEDMKKTIEERRTARREYETKNGNLLGDKRKSYDDRGDRRDDRRDRDRDRERDRDRRDKDKDRKRSRSRDRDRRNRSRSRERDRKSSSRRDSSRDRKRDRR